MKQRKIWFEIIIFTILFAVCLAGSYNVLRYKDMANGGGMEGFYANKAPIEVVAFGSSHAGCTVNNSILWEKYGISSYTLWSGAQSIDGIYYFMEEAFRINKPKVALVETLTFAWDTDDSSSLYKSALTTKFSTKYIDYILWKAKENQYSREFTEELLFRMPIVHSRYKELKKEDFYNQRQYNRGYSGSIEIQQLDPPEVTEDRAELPEHTLTYVDKMIKLCQEEGVELIFFNAPYKATAEDVAYQNTLGDYFGKKGITFFNMTHDYELYDINFSEDMREESHLNNSGAAKVTNFLGGYLTEKCMLGNSDDLKKNDYSNWDIHTRFLEDKEIGDKLRACTDIDSYMKELNDCKDNFTIVIALNGDYKAIETYANKPDFGSLGLANNYENGESVVLQKGTPIYASSQEEFQYHLDFEKNAELNLFKNKDEEFAHVIINDEDITSESSGFRIAVYDESCAVMIDAAYVDVYSGEQLIHDFGESN